MLFSDYAPDTGQAILAFLFAGAVAWMLVPSTERLARRLNAIDYPSERGLHEAPTPRLGGIAVLVAVLAAGVIFLPWTEQTRAILAGALVIAMIGVLDDTLDLNPALKLAGQTIAAVIPVSAGIGVQDFTLPFVGRVEPGDLGLPFGISLSVGDIFTVIGIVAIVNVINFSDGVDGLAAGVCLISAVSLAAVALSLERYEAGVLAGITAGASLGFLRHGFPPASSFMGDTGSNLLGYLLATIAIQGSLKTNAVLALALPLIVLAVPILDTSFVIAKRLKHGQPIYRADRWHFHHRMANIGFSQRRTLAYLYGWTLIAAGMALALRFIPYSDDRGNFDPVWTVVMGLLVIAALAASIYVIYVLEILKLRHLRLWQRLGPRAPEAPPPVEAEVDDGVKRELETGTYAAVNRETGEMSAVDPETGEMEPVEPKQEREPVEPKD
ncbi:MAG: undecaprenyl/decaprenyl-phosphate alpha-N-acetylglucosaminyl 1-phosphate transferase [Actinobacteria bacterium]|nr:undecaprenyl/decaprenyl-phosphate alpha-N-acetylglucosaminyl 1-phosphate transferase [Actinomycetota bacterium]